MAQFNPQDLLNKYKQILTSGAGKLSSFIQQNPTPAGFANQQFQQRVAQPVAQRVSNAPVMPFLPNVTPKSYVQGQVIQPIKSGVQQFQQPGLQNKLLGGMQIFGGAMGATPSGALWNIYSGAAAGIGQAIREKKNPQQTIAQGINKPTSMATTGLGINNPLFALGIDVLTPGLANKGVKFAQAKKLINTPGLTKIEARLADSYPYFTKKIQEITAKGDMTQEELKALRSEVLEEALVNMKALGKTKDELVRMANQPRQFLQYLTQEAQGYATQRSQALSEGVRTNLVGKSKVAKGRLGDIKTGILKPSQTKTQLPEIQPTKTTGKGVLEAPLTKPAPIQPTELKPSGKSIDPSETIIPPAGKERGFVTNVKSSPVTKKDVAEQVSGYYTPTTNKELITKASYLVNTDHDTALRKIMNEPLTPENNAIGLELMRQAQNNGRFDEAVQIAEHMAKKGTQLGQSVQAFSIWGRLTPEGMLKYAQKEFLNANEKMDILTKTFRRAFGQGKVEFTGEDAKVITELMQKANKTTDEQQRAKLIQETFEYIGKKMPWGISDVVDEYRYNNMLSNPLTHLRNVWSNLMQTYITRPATLATQGKLPDAVKYEIGAVKALPNAIKNALSVFKEMKPLQRMDDLSQISPIKPKRLGKLANLPSTALEAMDQFFTSLIKGGEELRGTAPDEATRIAQKYLFREDLKPTGQGALLNKMDELTKSIYGLRKVGLGWFIPFVRTPMNVAKQWIEYSPAGLATLPGSANKREQLAKAALGSLVTLAGANIALEGRTTWAAPTDEKQKKLFYDSGRKPYSVKIGDKWIPMQTFGVFAYALGIPAAVKYYNEDSRTALTDTDMEKLIKNVSALAGFWSNQTFVSGLGSFVKLAEGDTDYTLPKNIAYTVGQLKPMAGLMRYVSTIVDPIYRKARTVGEQLMSDVPFLTKNLPFYENSIGMPSERNITNYIAPYGMGIENKEFEEPYQMRTQQLQQNAVNNMYKKQIEQEAQKQFEGVQAAGGELLLGGTSQYDKMRNKMMIDAAKEKIKIHGGLVKAGDMYIYKEGDSVKTIDLNHEVPKPELTGQTELDKKKISSYKSKINSEINSVVKLQELGVYTAEQAEKLINDLKDKSSVKTGTGTKKPKKITFKKVSYKLPKVSTSKVKKIKIPKPKKLVVKNYKIVAPKLKKSKLKKTAKL